MARSLRTDITIGARLGAFQNELKKLEPEARGELQRLAVAMERDLKKIERANARSAKTVTTSWQSELKSVGRAAAKATAAVGAALAGVGAAVVKAVDSTANLRNELTSMETATGISASALAGLRLAAEGSGDQIADMEGGLKRLGVQIRDAAAGSAKSAAAFRQLGVAFEDGDGRARAIEDVLGDISDRFTEGVTSAEDMGAATDLMGRRWEKLANALNGVPLERHIAQARLLGLDVAPAAAKSADDWRRSMAAFQGAVKGAVAEISDLVGAGRGLDSLTAGVVYMRTITVESFRAIGEAGGFLADFYAGLFSLDLGKMQASTEDLATLVRAVGNTAANAAAEVRELQAAMAEGAPEVGGGGGGRGGGADGRAEAAREHALALQELERIIDEVYLAELSEGERAIELHHRRVAAVHRLKVAEEDRGEIAVAVAALEAQERSRLARVAEEEALAIAEADAKAAESLAQIRDEMERHGADDVDRVTSAYLGRVEAIEAVEAQLGETHEVRVAYAEAERLLLEELDEIERSMHAERMQRLSDAVAAAMDFAGELGELGSYLLQEEVGRIREASDARSAATREALAEERERIATAARRGELSQEEHAAALERLRDERRANMERRREELRAMRRAFRADQSLRSGQAVMDAARAALALIPSFAWMGPLAPAGAAAAVAPSLGLSLAKIWGESPPSFPMGGLVSSLRQGPSPGSDHLPILVRPDESVLSPRGTRTAGEAGVAALNRGEPPVVHVAVQLGRRTLAGAVRAVGDSVVRTERRSGMVPVYGGG